MFIKSFGIDASTILFFLSLLGTVVLGLHPRLRNYVVPGKKTMSFVQAGTLMFTGLYSSSILYWSFFDNLLFKDDPNFIALFPDKVGNAPFLTAITSYNWGMTLYMLLFIPIIVVIFVALFKDKYLDKKYKLIIKFIFIALAFFSITRIAGSLASYILPLKYILNIFSGINSDIFIVSLLLIGTFWSASGGLSHIKKLANICALIIFVYIGVFIVKLFILDEGAVYLYKVFQEFSGLLVNPNFISAQLSFNNIFIEEWTMLFAAMQIAAAVPAFYFFYIIMQGRPVKELILIYNIFVIAPTFLIFAVNSSIVQILAQKNNIILTADNYFDMYHVMFNFINLGSFPAIILFLSMFTLIVTSVDSIIYACANYLNILIYKDKKKQQYTLTYIFFAVIFLLLLGGFLMYVLQFKSKPIIAVRLYELNFVACAAIFIPVIYMIYKVVKTLCWDKTQNIDVHQKDN